MRTPVPSAPRETVAPGPSPAVRRAGGRLNRNRPHQILSFLCGTLGVLLIFAAVLFGYARRSLFDERAFAARVASSLEDPHVAQFAAEQLTDALLRANPDLVGLRPVLIGVSRSVIASEPFRAAVRRGARALHHAILTGTATDIVLTVKDVGAVVESAVATQPGLATKIPPGVATRIGRLQSLPGGERALLLARFAHRARFAILGVLLLGIGLCAASVWLSHGKRWALVRLGLALAALALVLALTATFGGLLLSLFARRAEMAPVVAGLTGAFLRGLMAWAFAVGFTGLVVASASASLLERVPLTDWARHTGRWFTASQPLMRLRLARGVLGTLAGTALLFWPIPTLTVVAWLAGLAVAFLGLREAFVAALHLLPQFEPRARERRVPAGRAPFRIATAAVSVFVAALIAGVGWWILRTPDTATEPQVVTAYNGSPALGERRLDQVFFPTTHNSMGAPDVPGWMFPNQSAGIRQQLEDGIRGFLIDMHYGVPVGEHVRTEIEDEVVAMAKYEGAIGEAGMAAVIRIRDRMTGEETGERSVYMCHGFCELGALELVPELRQIREFLVANPGEVLILVIQDEGVPPQELERCFQESGLLDFIYQGPAGPPWPTLREMVESDQRVLVMMENDSEGVPWCHAAIQLLQETPYGFHDPAEFSNQPNRGGTAGSLYLMNHWIESTPMPLPSNAALVNAREALLDRIAKFERERGHIPNLVAVDFYKEGDLIAVARELNERPPAQERRRRR